MYQFMYWLEHFKELPPSKSQAILRTLLQLSARTQGACSQVGKLDDCNTLLHRRFSVGSSARRGGKFTAKKEGPAS